MGEDLASAQLAIAAAFNASAANEAYLKADAIRVRVLGPNEDLLTDQTLPFSPAAAAATRVQVRLDGEAAGESVFVIVEILAGGETIFEGFGSGVPARGTPAPIEVELFPVVAAIDAPQQAGPITAIGGSIQLEATPLYATGDPATDVPVAWLALDQDIVTVNGSGLATAIRAGTGRVRVSAGAASAIINVLVQPSVASVDISPPSATIPLGDRLAFTAMPRDANGNIIGGRPVQWGTTNPDRLQVDANGLAVGVSIGTAAVTATVDGIMGSAPVTIIQIAPATPSLLGAESSGTDVVIGWIDNSTDETRFEVHRADVEAGSGAAGPPILVAELPPSTTSYFDPTGAIDRRFEYTVSACNAGGCSPPSEPAFATTIPRAPRFDEWRIEGDYWLATWIDNSLFETEQSVWYRSLFDGGSFVLYKILPHNEMKYLFDSEDGHPDIDWEYRLAACNAAGCAFSPVVLPPFGQPPAGGKGSGGTR